MAADVPVSDDTFSFLADDKFALQKHAKEGKRINYQSNSRH
jgi:hypothetical protein